MVPVCELLERLLAARAPRLDEPLVRSAARDRCRHARTLPSELAAEDHSGKPALTRASAGGRVDQLGGPGGGDRGGGHEHEHAAVVERPDVGLCGVLVEAGVDE